VKHWELLQLKGSLLGVVAAQRKPSKGRSLQCVKALIQPHALLVLIVKFLVDLQKVKRLQIIAGPVLVPTMVFQSSNVQLSNKAQGVRAVD
jgi:hypothetical protein